MCEELHMHYVCTHSEAEKLIESNDNFWIEDCYCRTPKGGCSHTGRVDVCLNFTDDFFADDSKPRSINKDFARELIHLAEEKNLITRPFRNLKKSDKAVGICFCCDCCCEYFLEDVEEPCDKGKYIEKTDMDLCTDCGICEQVCYFKARIQNNGKLNVKRDNCYGCGLCFNVCPENCIEMVIR